MENEEPDQDEWVRDLFLSLREDDHVFINDRTRPLTVETREWDDRESGYWRYTFSGYGTTYSCIVAPEQTTGISLRSEGGKDVFVSDASIDQDGDVIVSDTRADEFLAQWDQPIR